MYRSNTLYNLVLLNSMAPFLCVESLQVLGHYFKLGYKKDLDSVFVLSFYNLQNEVQKRHTKGVHLKFSASPKNFYIFVAEGGGRVKIPNYVKSDLGNPNNSPKHIFYNS